MYIKLTKTVKIVLSTVLLSVSLYSAAAEMNVSASFTPSITNPDNSAFTNTTPQGGYCGHWPGYCPTGHFSISLPLTLNLKQPIVANDDIRRNPYFDLPAQAKTVQVRNESTGDIQNVIFSVDIFSAAMNGQNANWGSSFMYPDGTGCGFGMNSVSAFGLYYFIWNVNDNDSPCYKISDIDRSDVTTFSDMSVGYSLQTPDPMKMHSGVYKGTLQLTVGPGGDFDFGDVYEADDNVVNVNFTLTVTHELTLTTTPDNTSVALQPCTAGKICTADEGKANWERWMVSRITPELTGRSAFNLSSSGEFSVYLDCAEQSGSDCALKSDSNGQLVPVKTMLNLPDNIVDRKTSATVSKRLLTVGKDVTNNVFSTTTYGADRPGSLDFLIKQRDVDTMLKTRPDTYRGTVTVIFDPNIY